MARVNRYTHADRPPCQQDSLQANCERQFRKAYSKALSEPSKRKWKGVNGRQEGGRNGPRAKIVLVYVLYQVKRKKEERASKKKLKYIEYIERA